MTFQKCADDPLTKTKRQGQFLLDRALQAISMTSPPEICQLFEHGLNNMLYFTELQSSSWKNEKAVQEIQVEKWKNILAEKEKIINQYVDRDRQEDERQKNFWKTQQQQREKYRMFEEMIIDLFTNDQALVNMKIELPLLLRMTPEELASEDENRDINHRRMHWLANDLKQMTQLINMDVVETAKIQIETNTEGLLQTDVEELKAGVASGMQNQLSVFHVKLEEVLKEN